MAADTHAPAASGWKPRWKPLAVLAALITLITVTGCGATPTTTAPQPNPLPASPTAVIHGERPSQATLPPTPTPGAGPGPQRPAPRPRPAAVALPTGPLPPVIIRVPTRQRVVFVTIDDGWTANPAALELIRSHHLPVTVFLVDGAYRHHPAYFQALAATGAQIEDHTLTHPDLTDLPLPAQEHEICGAATAQQREFGRRPTLLRPPYGIYDRLTQTAAHHCGMRALVRWDATVTDGHLDTIDGLRPGSIILLHFKEDLLTDLTVALDAVHRAGLTVAPLGSYLGN